MGGVKKRGIREQHIGLGQGRGWVVNLYIMLMSCENGSGGQQSGTGSPKRRSLQRDSLLQAITLPKHNNLLESQKQNIRDPKPKLAEKTQRIRKDKKNERKNNNREDNARAEIEQLEVTIVEEAVDRLRDYLALAERRGRKPRETEEERLLEFLEKIEGEYSDTVRGYMKQNINKDACGNLRGMLTRFVNQVITSFPLLQQHHHFTAQQYAEPGPLKHRFQTLMCRNITPLICCHPTPTPNQHPSPDRSPSPDREEEPQLSEDERKLEKKKRRSKKRRERRESQVEEEKEEKEEEGDVEELNRFLESLSIKEEGRVECRVGEERLERWGARRAGLRSALQ